MGGICGGKEKTSRSLPYLVKASVENPRDSEDAEEPRRQGRVGVDQDEEESEQHERHYILDVIQ